MEENKRPNMSGRSLSAGMPKSIMDIGKEESKDRMYSLEELKKVIQTFADNVDDLYRSYTRNNTLAWEYIDEFLKTLN